MPSLPASSLPVPGMSYLPAQPPSYVPIAPVGSRVHATTLIPFGGVKGTPHETELCSR